MVVEVEQGSNEGRNIARGHPSATYFLSEAIQMASSLSFLTIAAVGLILLMAGGVLAVPDTPYVEIVPDRYTFQDQPVIEGWGMVPAKCCVTQALPQADGGTVLMMDSGKLLLAHARAPDTLGAPRSFSKVDHVSSLAGARLFLDGGSIAGLAGRDGIAELNCSFPAAGAGGASCTAGAPVSVDFGGDVVGSLVAASSLFVAAQGGLFRCAWKGTSQSKGRGHAAAGGGCVRLLGADAAEKPMTALAAGRLADFAPSANSQSPSPPVSAPSSAPSSAVIAVGSADKLWLLNASSGAVLRWEWTSVIDGPL